ncbi:hypothetical protein HYC85_021870 [Camellia sinensis]|uniref:Uncharacterized protein n=1 Tax=Camellia sinensis TaxID=4442 RepID=A0A7J7GIS4_CAMSI|nr:hypothetical protein HYC85_021870 [Camellia sinensis]
MSSTSSSAATNAQSPVLKTYFKTQQGRYKLHYEKTYPAGLLHYSHGKTVTLVTLAHLKDKPMQALPSTSSSMGISSGVRSAAARLLGGGNGSRALSFVGGNGGSKSVSGPSRVGSLGASNPYSLMGTSNFDGKGTYLVFNVGDTIYISDLNSQDKDPIKSIIFSNSNPVCHAFDTDAKDGHDLLIGLNSGDVYSVSLRQQLQDVGKKLVGAQHYNKDGCVNNRQGFYSIILALYKFVVQVLLGFPMEMALSLLLMQMEICTCMKRQALNINRCTFHGLLNFNKDGSGDPSFPLIKDQTQFSVAHARYSKVKVPADKSETKENMGTQLLDGIFAKVQLIALLFQLMGHILQLLEEMVVYVYLITKMNNSYVVAKAIMVLYYVALGGEKLLWLSFHERLFVDGKYILTGGEDDLVQVWSMEDRKVVAWGEGHNSWVSGVAFDSYWSSPSSDGLEEHVMYRFGSVGQDTQLLLWDLEMDEIVVPLRRAPGGSPTVRVPGGSPTFSTGKSVISLGQCLPCWYTATCSEHARCSKALSTSRTPCSHLNHSLV